MKFTYENQQKIIKKLLELVSESDDDLELLKDIASISSYMVSKVGFESAPTISFNEYIYELIRNKEGADNQELVDWFYSDLIEDLKD